MMTMTIIVHRFDAGGGVLVYFVFGGRSEAMGLHNKINFYKYFTRQRPGITHRLRLYTKRCRMPHVMGHDG